MFKKNKLLIIGIIAFLAVHCWGATSTPWDGTTWDTAAPDIDQPIGNHYKEIYDLRKGIAIRMNKEHETLATSSAGGVHKQGSARAFFQDAAPATQVNGAAWDSGDTGSLWFDTNSTPDNLVYVLTDSAGAGTWTLLSTSLTAEIVAAAHSWAGVQTFDLQSVHTLGILSNDAITLGDGDDLVGSATSSINMNAFDVDENGVGTIGTSLDIASTIAVVGTLDDDTMGTATDTTLSTSESIKAYIDAQVAAIVIPSSLTGDNDSIGVTAIGELRLAWGSESVIGNATDTITITGFTKLFQVIVSYQSSAVDIADSCSAHSYTAANFKITNSDGSTLKVSWLAIGR